MPIKQSPRDFHVRELLEFPEDPAGEFYVHLLKKEKIDTQEALSLISRNAKVPRGDIAFAGLKDRQGRTEQWISIRGRRVDVGLGVSVGDAVGVGVSVAVGVEVAIAASAVAVSAAAGSWPSPSSEPLEFLPSLK